MKTIKQIADEIGVDKQKVYRYIKKNCINEALQKNGMMYYDDVAQNRIKQGFSQKEPLQASASNDAVYDVLLKQYEVLQKELEIKNQQIENLQKALDNTTEALKVSQESLMASQALQANAEKKLLLLEETSGKKWWKFGKG